MKIEGPKTMQINAKYKILLLAHLYGATHRNWSKRKIAFTPEDNCAFYYKLF